MRRRVLLSTITCATSALLAGCNSQNRENEVKITVHNASQHPISMAIFFTRGDFETVFSAQYSLNADKADESKGFTGTAEREYIIVDEAQGRAVDFYNQTCSGTNHVIMGVLYSEAEGIQVGFACAGLGDV